jgi:ABC-type sugar transport system substrate-binding protein
MPEPLLIALQAALLRVGSAPEHAQAPAGLHIAAIMPSDGLDYAIQLRCEAQAAALGYADPL